MRESKWLLTADRQWLAPNESKVFRSRWYNEDEVVRLIIATIWSYHSLYFIISYKTHYTDQYVLIL